MPFISSLYKKPQLHFIILLSQLQDQDHSSSDDEMLVPSASTLFEYAGLSFMYAWFMQCCINPMH